MSEGWFLFALWKWNVWGTLAELEMRRCYGRGGNGVFRSVKNS
jgi:hypothetical protein